MVRIIKWLIVVLVFGFGVYMVAEWKMKKEVVEFLDRKVPDHISFSYDNLQINLLKGNLDFQNIQVISLGRQTSSCEIRVKANNLSITGFSYWKIFLKKSVYVESLTLSKPHLNFKTCPKTSAENTAKSNPIQLLKEIFIEDLIFDSGIVEIWDDSEETALVAVQSIDLHLKKVATDPKVITHYVPFTFADYGITIQNFKAPLGEFEMLQMEVMKLDNKSIDVNNLSLATILSKKDLSQKITYQRDHVNLFIPGITVNRHKYKISNDSLQVNFKSFLITEPLLEMYRDKSRLENLETRPLYAELLRKLPFKIAVDSVFIEKGSIMYEEDIPNIAKAGVLSFEDLDATISNLSNLIQTDSNLKIELDTELMGAGRFNLNWEFNVQDQQNTFLVSGGLSNFKTANLNDFLVPNLRAKTSGTIDQLYFTISGDDNVASGDIKMKYEDFKFQVLNKERNGVKKVLSFIGNLFINDGSNTDNDGYRHGNISTERSKNKSFFNYLWINLEDGLLDVLTGSGKKK